MLRGFVSLTGTLATACFEREHGRPASKAAEPLAPHSSTSNPRAAPSASQPEVAASQPASAVSQLSSASAPVATSNAPAPMTMVIYLKPLGSNLAQSDVEFIEAALSLYFPFPIRRLPNDPLPPEAYYAPRKRYRAERLLAHLEQRTPLDAQVIVGLTESDISTTKGNVYDWGILGLATLSGRQCVISRFRAQRDALNAQHVQQRLAKTVIHEVGHTIGLDHCPNYGCIMEDGKGTVTTTDHERDVCAECRARVGKLLLSPPDQLPW